MTTEQFITKWDYPPSSLCIWDGEDPQSLEFGAPPFEDCEALVKDNEKNPQFGFECWNFSGGDTSNSSDFRWLGMGFPKFGVPQDGWFIREKPIKMDDLRVPLSQET